MAAATILPVIASGSTSGKQIAVGTSSTALHTADATAIDSVSVMVCNTSAATRTLTLYWGSTGAGDTSTFAIPAGDGWYAVTVGRRATGSVAITAKGDAAGLYADVSVDRYTAAS